MGEFHDRITRFIKQENVSVFASQHEEDIWVGDAFVDFDREDLCVEYVDWGDGRAVRVVILVEVEVFVVAACGEDTCGVV